MASKKPDPVNLDPDTGRPKIHKAKDLHPGKSQDEVLAHRAALEGASTAYAAARDAYGANPTPENRAAFVAERDTLIAIRKDWRTPNIQLGQVED